MSPGTHVSFEDGTKAPVDLIDDSVLTTLLMPWSPEQGPGSDAPFNVSDDDRVYRVDTSVEGRWAPRRPSGDRPAIVQIVDGVRRIDAHAMSETTSGAVVPALFGSYAAGVVRCEPGRATVLTDRRLLRLERCFLHAGTAAEDVFVAAGQAELRFCAAAVRGAMRPSDLVDELGKKMLAAEADLTNSLSEDTSALTLVDGPLRTRPTGWRVAGYIKRTAQWYLGPEERAIFNDLGVGDRTPLFRLAGGRANGARPNRERLAWYVRIADLGPHLHPLASVMRLETWATLPVEQAARLADECALTLPRLAGSLMRDPRAPQNLTPVSGLEDVLRHRLGNREWLQRRIAEALANRAPQGMPLATTKGMGS